MYKWLTSDTQHLKKHCKRKPPYDWSDILEKSKDEAMERISNGGDQHTSYYWNLAKPTEDCPNWIARWFLYHKFRYRDGRNRNAARGESSRSSGKSGHKQHSTPVSSSSQSARSGGYSEDQRSSRYQARTFEGNDREHDGSTSTYSYYPQSQPCLQGHSQSQGRMAYQSPSSAFSECLEISCLPFRSRVLSCISFHSVSRSCQEQPGGQIAEPLSSSTWRKLHLMALFCASHFLKEYCFVPCLFCP